MAENQLHEPSFHKAHKTSHGSAIGNKQYYGKNLAGENTTGSKSLDGKHHYNHGNSVGGINRTTTETLRLGADLNPILYTNGTGNMTIQQLHLSAAPLVNVGGVCGGGNTSQRKQRSSFQITSVTVGNKLSADNGEDSADDLDESHTDENSRVTDLENETPSISEDTFSKEDVFFSSHALGTAPVIPTSSQYGLVIVDPESNVPGQNLQNVHVSVCDAGINIVGPNEKEIQHRSDRFKVVKIESTEPFKRGRWMCMDYLDHSNLSQNVSENTTDSNNDINKTGEDNSNSDIHTAGSSNDNTGKKSNESNLDMNEIKECNGGGVGIGGIMFMQSSPGHSLKAPISLPNKINANPIDVSTVNNENIKTNIMSNIHQNSHQNMNNIPSNTANIMQSVQQTAHSQSLPQSQIQHSIMQGNVSQQQISQQQQPLELQNVVTSETYVPGQSQQLPPVFMNMPKTDQIHGSTLPSNIQMQTTIQPQQLISNQQTSQINTGMVIPTSSMPSDIQLQSNVLTQSIPQGGVSTVVSQNQPQHSNISNEIYQQQQQQPSQPQHQPHNIPLVHPSNIINQNPQVGNIGEPIIYHDSGQVNDIILNQQHLMTDSMIQQQQQQQPQHQQQLNIGQPNEIQIQDILITNPNVTTINNQPNSIPQTLNEAAVLISNSIQQVQLQQQQQTPPSSSEDNRIKQKHIDIDNTVSSLPCSGGSIGSGSSLNPVAIDNKIEQAMDLVKSHLMIAVREEVEVLKEKIAELMDRIDRLEAENTFLKANASQETLIQLQTKAVNIQQQQQPQQGVSTPIITSINNPTTTTTTTLQQPQQQQVQLQQQSQLVNPVVSNQ